MSKKTHDSFQHIIEKVFHRNAHVLSHQVAFYHSLLEVFPKEDDVFHIHIDGEITEMMVVVSDSIKKIGTIPVGSNHLIRFLSKKMNIPFSKAKSLILMYQHNHLNDFYRDKVEFFMRESFLSWFKFFYDFLYEVSKEYIIPDTLLLVAPRDVQGWFSEWFLKTDEIQEHMKAKRNISIIDVNNVFMEQNKDKIDFLLNDDLFNFYFYYIEHRDVKLYE
jgi:hypothetical protein